MKIVDNIGTSKRFSPRNIFLAPEGNFWEVVVFKLAEQEYGLQLTNVVEIIRMIAITRIPEPEDKVEGIINLRGEIVPLIDLRKFLGLPARPYTLNTHIVIVRVNGKTIGLVVDSVTKVLPVARENIKPPRQIVPHSRYLSGVAKTNGHLLLILDINSILKTLDNGNGLSDKFQAQANAGETFWAEMGVSKN